MVLVGSMNVTNKLVVCVMANFIKIQTTQGDKIIINADNYEFVQYKFSEICRAQLVHGDFEPIDIDTSLENVLKMIKQQGGYHG